MRYFLIQPTHRKFVRLLRESLTGGTPIVLNEDDISNLLSLLRIKTMRAVERHKRLYKIFLCARRRPYCELLDDEKKVVIDSNVINYIEKRLFIAEWKHLGVTLQSSLLIPFLRWLLKNERRKEEQIK